MITAEGLIKLGFTPEIDFSLEDSGNGVFIREWTSSSPQPSESEIESAHSQWEIEWGASAYFRNRKPEYPPIGDQLDDLFHRSLFSEEMTAKLQEVKDKYPKG